MRVALGIYVLGVAVALWPIGPAAFLGTVALLVAASTIAFPAVGALAGAGALIAWWALAR